MSLPLQRSWTSARLIVLGGILLGLQLKLWQPGGLFSAYRLQKKVAAQTEAIRSDQTRNQRLAAQVKWLYHSPDAVEHHARQSLGMVKPGETFYLWVEQD